MTYHPFTQSAGRQRGFTLIELVIVTLIIAVLTAVALPSYQKHAENARRADARNLLLAAQQYMQRYFAANNTYIGANLPSNLLQSPAQGKAEYQITVTNATVSTFALQATPAAGGSMTQDKCGVLSLTSTGQRGAKGGSATGQALADCWK
jgi:type IV pilus assembly protein PilE